MESIIRKSFSWLREINDLPIELKVQWTKILMVIYEDQMPAEQIMLLSSQSVNSKSLAALSPEETVEAIALVELLKIFASNSQDPKGERLLSDKILELTNKSGIANDTLRMKVQELAAKLDEERKRKHIRIPASIQPLVIDHLLRWLSLFFFIKFSLNDYFLLLSNFVVIPLITISYFIFLHKKIKIGNDTLISVYSQGEKVIKQIHVSAMQWVVLGVMIILGVMIAILHINEEDFIVSGIIPFLLFIIYYGLYLNIWGEGKLKEKDLNLQFHQKVIDPDRLSPELNDEIIVEKSVELKSITGKLDSYVLESALFGALAFSGFLQIMAENLVSFEDLENFGQHLYSLFRSIAFLDSASISGSLQDLSSKQDLFSLISLETLICSALFLIVIASRLRFTDKADEVDKHLELAKNFNEKEERYVDKRKKEGIEEKVMFYNKKIADSLLEGNRILDKMRPILSYMRHFRNAGIFTFFIVLITSALFISSFISWLIGMVALISYLYFNRQELQMTFDKFIYQLRVLFVLRGYYFLWSSILIFLLGFLGRTILKLDGTDFMINASFILMGLYAFTWITFAPHIDQQFEGEKSTHGVSWWFTIRLIWGISFFLTTIGFAFSLTSWVGANFALGFGILLLSIVLMIAGNYMSSRKILGTIMGLSLLVLTIGTILKSSFLPFAGQTMGIGYIGLSSLIVYLNYHKATNQFLALFRSISTLIVLWVTVLDIFNYLPESVASIALVVFGPLTVFSYWFWRPKIHIFHKVYITSIVFLVVISQVFLSVTRDFNSFEIAYNNYTLHVPSIQKIHELKINARIYSNEYGAFDRILPQSERTEFQESLTWYLGFIGDTQTEDKIYLIDRFIRGITHTINTENSTTNDLIMAEFFAAEINKIGKSMGYDAWYFKEKIKGWWGVNDYLLLYQPQYLQKLGRDDEAKRVAKEILFNGPELPDELKEELRKF